MTGLSGKFIGIFKIHGAIAFDQDFHFDDHYFNLLLLTEVAHHDDYVDTFLFQVLVTVFSRST